MLFKSACISMSLVLAASSSLANVDCKHPFYSNTSFYLTEPLDCKDQTSYMLYVSPDQNQVGGALPYLSASCSKDGTVGYNLYDGKIKQAGHKYNFIVSFTSPVGSSDAEEFKVIQSCTGQTAFRVSKKPESINVGGKPVDVDYQVFANDESGTLLAYVRTMDDAVNSMKLTSAVDGSEVASASKSFVASGNCGHAFWSVQNDASFDPTIISYILSLKDNDNFVCEKAAHHKSSSNLGGYIVGAVFVGACVVSTSLLALVAAAKQKPTWANWFGLRPYLRLGQQD